MELAIPSFPNRAISITNVIYFPLSGSGLDFASGVANVHYSQGVAITAGIGWAGEVARSTAENLTVFVFPWNTRRCLTW